MPPPTEGSSNGCLMISSPRFFPRGSTQPWPGTLDGYGPFPDLKEVYCRCTARGPPEEYPRTTHHWVTLSYRVGSHGTQQTCLPQEEVGAL
jgi:hypothetical protein